jgi:hypothetical protein
MNGWTSTEEAWPLPGIKVLGWWPIWGGMMHVVHFDKQSWIHGKDAQHGQKVMAPTHWQFVPDPPESRV